METDGSRARAGLFYALGAYLLWGFLPLYFKLLDALGPVEIVAHRILWSLVFLALLLFASRRWRAIRSALRTRSVLPLLAASAMLIGVNWVIYIWAVLNGHVLEGSLGYYLNPLVNIFMGVVVLKERLTRVQTLAVLLAGLGVAALALGAGDGLWISLTLAISFATYGLIRKIAPVESLEGLSIETAILAPVALGYLLWLGPAGGFPADAATNILVALAGVVTAVPLLLFAAGARRLPYATMGFLQYLAPSIQFLLAVFAFGERLTFAHIVCFGAIWAALALVAVDGLRRNRRNKGPQPAGC